MYLQHFQLHVEPFNIAPNPDMLFPSSRHQEAIGYLQHGLSGNGGFVMLTGEVGTGKTMVSRAVLAHVGDETNVAYILNPTLDALQLLQSVCEAFELTLPEDINQKSLSDVLQQFLLQQYQIQRRCLLVIDEAQHLSVEALELLRLFTNIETNERKLLQIVLIGQPELQEKLQRRELRQLAQRITARYHLLPLTMAETFAYVNHRVVVAGGRRPLFEKSALQTLYKLSAGTPRIINLIADRALMGAFAKGNSTVSKGLIQQAAKEVFGEPNMAQSGSLAAKVTTLLQTQSFWLFVSSLVIAGLSTLVFMQKLA